MATKCRVTVGENKWVVVRGLSGDNDKVLGGSNRLRTNLDRSRLLRARFSLIQTQSCTLIGHPDGHVPCLGCQGVSLRGAMNEA